MSNYEGAVADARRQALLMHGLDVHREEFNASLMRIRATDDSDPVPDELAVQHESAVADRRKTLGRLAKNRSTTPAKVMSDAAAAWEKELSDLLVAWEQELAVVQDMIANPDEYGHKLLDGRPMDVEQLAQGEVGLRAAIAHARQHLGVDDDTKPTKKVK